MFELTDAQTWTIIGVLAAAFACFVGLTVNLLGRTLTAQLAGITGGIRNLERRMDAFDNRMDRFEQRMDRFEQRMDRFEQRMDGFGQRLDGVERRLESLDHDVQAIAARVFRDEDRPA